MKTKRSGLVGAVALSLVALAGCPRKAEPTAQAEAVASLAELSGHVDHRRAGSLSWTPARLAMHLYASDALKTGRSATARVSFEGGSSLIVEQESLVVIERPPAAPPAARPSPAPSPSPAVAPPPQVARVEQGTIRGVIQPGAAPITVTTADGQVAELSSTSHEAVPFRVKVRSGGKLEVAVLGGTARVKSGGQTAVVGPKQVVEVQAHKISQPVPLPPYPELISPAVDEQFHAGIRVPLKWRAVPGASLYRVQVSDEISFSRSLVEETVTVPELSLAQPRPGRTYVWRVCSVDAAGREGEYGFARRFVVVTAPPPPTSELLSPPDNAGIQYVGSPKPIVFTWRSTAPQFELVISGQPKLTGKAVFRKRLRSTSQTVTSLTAGVYYWGVYALGPSGRQPLFDQARRLVIAQRLPPGVRVPTAIDWK